MKNTMKEITLNEMEMAAGGEDNRPEPKYALGQFVLFYSNLFGYEQGTIINMYYSDSRGCWMYEFGVNYYNDPYDNAYVICTNHTEEDIIRVL